MENEERTSFIIHHLSEGDDPNDLIYQICQRDKVPWSVAKEMVNRVQVEKEHLIVKKQFPLLFALALVIFLGGLALIGYSVFIYASEYSMLQAQLRSSPQAMGTIDAFSNLIGFTAMVFNEGGSTIFAFIIGIGMVLGSLVGMRNAWAKILEK